MAETFFGPWRVVFERHNLYYRERFVISGSDNADGEYEGYLGIPVVPIDITVSGAEWTIDLQLVGGPALPEWQSFDVVRVTQFVAPEGLTVRLTTQYHNMTVLCISMDPDINPIPTPNPFDFTIPEG